MSIGLYDMDMATYTLVPFNLEIMKLSTYFKKKREIVVLSPSFAPERHSKFILRKDYDDGIYIPNINSIENVDYGGYAFSGEIYSPLDEKIEACRPDTDIYAKMESQYLNYPMKSAKERRKIFNNLMTAEHCRISLDGKTIWANYPKQFRELETARNIIFHDYNLENIEGGFEEVKTILENARTDGWATKVGMKFPVQVNNGKSLLKWASLNPNSSFYSLRYDGVIDDDSFIEFVGRYKNRSIFTQLDYYVTRGVKDEEDFLKNYIQKIYRQVIISRSYRVRFTLKYDQDFFVHKEWEKVLTLFNNFHNNFSSTSDYLEKTRKDTLYKFARSRPKEFWKAMNGVLSKDEIRELFIFVHENHKDLFDDFYNCNIETLREEGLLL